MNTTPIFKSGAVERNRTSTGEAHSDLNAARLPFPPRPLGFSEAFPPGYGLHAAPEQGCSKAGAALANLALGCKARLEELASRPLISHSAEVARAACCAPTGPR
jgi:hypothetical protein